MTIRLAKIELRSSAHHNYDTVMILTPSLPIPIPIRCTDATCSEQASYLTYLLSCPRRASKQQQQVYLFRFPLPGLLST